MPELTEQNFVDRLSDGIDRPLAGFEAPEMEKLGRKEWEMPFTLYQIVCECKIRLQKNPRSRAKRILALVEPRFSELTAMPFPSEPNPSLGHGEFGDPREWPKVGLLKYKGYEVGKLDPGSTKRRQILTGIFRGPLPKLDDVGYMADWGPDRSMARLMKMA